MNDYSLAPTLTWIFLGLVMLFIGIYAWNELSEQADARPPAPDRVPQGGHPWPSPWETCDHCLERVLPENTENGWCQDCRTEHAVCYQDEMALQRVIFAAIEEGLAQGKTTSSGIIARQPDGEYVYIEDPTSDDEAAYIQAVSDEALDEEDHR